MKISRSVANIPNRFKMGSLVDPIHGLNSFAGLASSEGWLALEEPLVFVLAVRGF